MGGKQSVQTSHFQRPIPPETNSTEEDPNQHQPHISISNKMVERLVEDATLAGAAVADQSTALRGDYKDKVYMERLRCLDEAHSERTGLTVNDIKALATRVEYRTANMVSVEPVCAECKDKVIECYNELAENNLKCMDIVAEFSACVHEASAARLRARTKRDEIELARRSRHVALARQHELRDLGPGLREESTPA